LTGDFIINLDFTKCQETGYHIEEESELEDLKQPVVPEVTQPNYNFDPDSSIED
jgi:hypothetical protein